MTSSSQSAKASWPPLIPASNASWPVRWRDTVLTLFAWVLLFWAMRHALLALVASVDPGMAASIGTWLDIHLAFLPGRVDLPPPGAFWEEFRVYVYAAAAFVAWLTSWGWWNQAKLQRQPPEAGVPCLPADAAPSALPSETQFAAAGVPGPPELLWWASRRLCVGFDADGKPHVG
jgi:hypothetical protein